MVKTIPQRWHCKKTYLSTSFMAQEQIQLEFVEEMQETNDTTTNE